MPATGFYEPDEIHYQTALPLALLSAHRSKNLWFRGLYDIWKDKQTGKEIKSYTIITTTPNSLVGTIHDRMPVILDPGDEATWLNPDIVSRSDYCLS